MELIKKIFPYSFKEKANGVALLINILIYFVIGIVASVLIGVLVKIPIIGIIVAICAGLVDVYVLVGIVFSILDYAKVLK